MKTLDHRARGAAVATTRDVRRDVAASAIGNATEWFDYGIYAYGVTYIAVALFPGKMQQATLFALGVFAISFLMRPLGGAFWGSLGDRIGRRGVMAATIVLMAGATFGVGLLPTYAAAGFWAPTLLILLRMLQGFSTGGEYGGAATFMAEHAPDARRGFFGSFLEFGTLSGFSVGALLMLGGSLLLGPVAMRDWGWRLPFFGAAPLAFVGFYLRSRVGETPVFLAEKEPARVPLTRLLTRHWRPILTMSGLVIALNVVNYTLLSYMPTYFRLQLRLSTETALAVPIVGMLFMMTLLPFAGALSDRVGRKPMWWFSLGGLFMLALPIYAMMSTGVAGALVGFVVLGVLYAPQLATISATFPAMFPTRVRFAGFALAYNVATSIFGGGAPVFNSWLIGRTHDLFVPAYTMMASCAVGMAALCFTIETAGASLHGQRIPRREARSGA